MNIQRINATQSFGNKYPNYNFIESRFSGKLIGDNTAKIRMYNDGNKVHSMECYVFNKNGKMVGGYGIGANPFLKLVDIRNFLKKIDNYANGFNVFEEFANVIIK